MNFTPATLTSLRNRLNAILKPLAQELGINIEAGNAVYGRTGDNAKITLVMCNIAADGTLVSKEHTAFLQYCNIYGLKPDDLGRTFMWGGKTYKLVGLKPGNRYPFLAECGGRRYKLPEEVNLLLKAQHGTTPIIPPAPKQPAAKL